MATYEYCPACDRRVRLRNDGRLAKHADCIGSGEPLHWCKLRLLSGKNQKWSGLRRGWLLIHTWSDKFVITDIGTGLQVQSSSFSSAAEALAAAERMQDTPEKQAAWRALAMDGEIVPELQSIVRDAERNPKAEEVA